jgi:hypothetical protein
MNNESTDVITITETNTSTIVERRHLSNQKLVELWLDGRPGSTTRRYLYWANHFLDKAGDKPLYLATLEDAQYWG